MIHRTGIVAPGHAALRASLAGVMLIGALASRAYSQSPWPTNGWATGTPASVGVSEAVLDSIDAEIQAGKYGFMDHFLVIRHGRVVYDRRYRNDYDRAYGDSTRHATGLRVHHQSGAFNYFNTWWHPYYRRGDLHTLQSVTKTVTSMIIGVAVTRGEFPSLDTPVLTFFDSTKVANLDDRKRRMTIRHLMTMTSGIDWNENLPYADTSNAGVRMEASYDWTQFTIDRRMAGEPGASFNYNSGASALLAHIFFEITGTDIEEYAARTLFAPLGIRDWYWKRTPAGLPDTEGGLYLAAGDLAKLAYLFLHDGEWDGLRVISRDWVRQSVSPLVAFGGARGGAAYGLKWWLYRNPVDSTRTVWAGSGFGGQRPLIVPESDLIIVTYAWNILPGQPGLPLAPTLRRVLRGTSP